MAPAAPQASVEAKRVWDPNGRSEAPGGIGDPQVRNWGTIGGSVAHADPASPAQRGAELGNLFGGG